MSENIFKVTTQYIDHTGDYITFCVVNDTGVWSLSDDGLISDYLLPDGTYPSRIKITEAIRQTDAYNLGFEINLNADKSISCYPNLSTSVAMCMLAFTTALKQIDETIWPKG